MALTALAKKLFRTLARVFPQCGMVSQAVAFNMFLAFFAVLLTALSVTKRGKTALKVEPLGLRTHTWDCAFDLMRIEVSSRPGQTKCFFWNSESSLELLA